MYKLSKADHAELERRRGCYPPGASWWGLLVHWGRERDVARRLEGQFGSQLEELLLPQPEPGGELLFGGHLFVRCRLSDPLYEALATQPNVFKLLGRAWRIPEPIADAEMERFRAVLTVQPPPCLTARAARRGQRARVREGLLAGLEGRVLEATGRWVRLEVRFSFLQGGEALVISVAPELLELAETREAEATKATERH